jgi:hypothetical protein
MKSLICSAWQTQASRQVTIATWSIFDFRSSPHNDYAKANGAFLYTAMRNACIIVRTQTFAQAACFLREIITRHERCKSHVRAFGKRNTARICLPRVRQTGFDEHAVAHAIICFPVLRKLVSECAYNTHCTLCVLACFIVNTRNAHKSVSRTVTI